MLTAPPVVPLAAPPPARSTAGRPTSAPSPPGSAATSPAPSRAAAVVAALPAAAWVRHSAGDGAKGPRLYDWAWAPIRPLKAPGKGYWVLARRSLADPDDRAYYVCYGPAATTLAEPVRVAGARWAIEEGLEAA